MYIILPCFFYFLVLLNSMIAIIVLVRKNACYRWVEFCVLALTVGWVYYLRVTMATEYSVQSVGYNNAYTLELC